MISSTFNFFDHGRICSLQLLRFFFFKIGRFEQMVLDTYVLQFVCGYLVIYINIIKLYIKETIVHFLNLRVDRSCPFIVLLKLTHLSLASFLWDIGKQYSPRCDATERLKKIYQKGNKISKPLLSPLK